MGITAFRRAQAANIKKKKELANAKKVDGNSEEKESFTPPKAERLRSEKKKS